MKALLLAAGFGTRLKPLTDHLPKCLAPIQGVSLLEYWLDFLFADRLIDEVLINTHYQSDLVNDFIAHSAWKDRITVVYEDALLGTGGTIKKNHTFFSNEPCLIIHADNLSIFDLRQFIACFNERPDLVDLTMMLFPTDHPQECGIVELDAAGCVLNFFEKVKSPPSNLANAAIYIASQNFIQHIVAMPNDIIDLSTEVIPLYLGHINTYRNTIYHSDIGSMASLRKAQADFPKTLASSSNPAWQRMMKELNLQSYGL